MKALFVRRLVPPPACHGTYGCPDLWELADGDFAVIGEDITALAAQLPPGAGCAPTERMVRVPRALLVQARGSIPNEP